MSALLKSPHFYQDHPMKKLLTGSALAAVLVVAGISTAHAEDHNTPGTPGTASCRGQTTAYLAQAAKNGLIDGAYHGIGGIGRYADLSVSEVHAVIDNFCAR
jgi:hypothetical protein